jgi:hypothetical protein
LKGQLYKKLLTGRCIDCGRNGEESFKNLDSFTAGNTPPQLPIRKIGCKETYKGKFCQKKCRRYSGRGNPENKQRHPPKPCVGVLSLRVFLYLYENLPADRFRDIVPPPG